MRRCALLLVGLTASAAAAQSAKPAPVFEFWPEINAYYKIDKRMRGLITIAPTFIPADQFSDITFSAFVDVFAFRPFQRASINDDAKERLLSFRFGGSYIRTFDPGTRDPSELVVLLADIQGRYRLPWALLLSLRNRAEFRQEMVGEEDMVFRERVRPQLEREFKLPPFVAITPYANAEIFWSTSGGFTQFRFQPGVTADVKWFSRGQSLELYYLLIVDLRDGRPNSHIFGVGLNFYF